MTTADFVAACFSPLALLFAVLLKTVHEPILLWRIRYIAGLFVMLCVVLMAAYGQSSLVAVVDLYLFLVGLGVWLIWFGLGNLCFFVPDLKLKLKAYSAVLGGAAIAFVAGTILIQDFLQSRIVLEGRVANVRDRGTRHSQYVADVAGYTVRVTTPLYERLKLLPVVRVEVGRGSNYVYGIEYLAN